MYRDNVAIAENGLPGSVYRFAHTAAEIWLSHFRGVRQDGSCRHHEQRLMQQQSHHALDLIICGWPRVAQNTFICFFKGNNYIGVRTRYQLSLSRVSAANPAATRAKTRTTVTIHSHQHCLHRWFTNEHEEKGQEQIAGAS